MELWRPVGPVELDLIADSDRRCFPQRLPEQPIFYPVLNFAYAEQIARDWNSIRADSSYFGFVVAFDVADAVAELYPAQTAGAAQMHRELWAPAEEIGVFNDAIQGKIRLIATYRHGARVEE